MPTTSAIHDKTRQSKSFGNLSYYLDDDTRLGMMFGTYNGRFQIPNNPGQAPGFSLTGVSDADAGTSVLPSDRLDQNQHETNRFLVLSLQKSMGDFNFQASGFRQYSELHYRPDPLGDLVYLGVASDSLRSDTSTEVQFDMSYKLRQGHTLRAGLATTRQATESNNTIGLFTTDASGAQSSPDPITVVDDNSRTGRLSSIYLQDEWRIAKPLTLNYGVRFDKVSAFIDEQQWSPRLNLSYKVNEATAIHAGYSRYFTPPPQELIAQSRIDLYANTTNAPEITASNPVKAERTHYYDIGISHQVNSNLTLSADAYYKKVANLIDEGQFGQALILTPFNYERAYAKGLELSAVYSRKNWGAYLNATIQTATGSNIISSQSLFGADELAYIANKYIHLDHDQAWTVSGGGHYHFGDSQVSADMLYGSGMRSTPDGGTPNSGTLPSYTTVTAAFTHTWKNTRAGELKGRIALINAFDRVYQLRDGSGVGVGAPQFGPRRTLYVGMSTSF